MLHDILKMLFEITLKRFTFIDSFFGFANLLESERILKVFFKCYNNNSYRKIIIITMIINY